MSPMTSTASTLRRSGSPPRPGGAPRTPSPPPARSTRCWSAVPATTPTIGRRGDREALREVDVPVGGLGRGGERADNADRRQRGAGGLALVVAEPEHQQGHDDRSAAHAEERAERPGRGSDRGEARWPGGHRGAYYGRCPLRPQTRSLRRCARCSRTPGGPPCSATWTARSPRSSSAPRTPTCARRSPCCWAGSPGATAAWRASPAARRPRRAASWGSAGSHTRAPTGPSCSPRATRPPRWFRPSRAGRGASAASRTSATPRELRLLRVRTEDKGPIAAFHWRGVPDEEAARTHLEGIAQRCRGGRAGHPLGAQGARDPPARADRQGPRRPRAGGGIERSHGALRRRRRHRPGRLRGTGGAAQAGRAGRGRVRGRALGEGPDAIVERADVVVDGVDGFTRVLAALDAD